MPTLRKLLRACFANAALIYLMSSFSMVPVLIQSMHSHTSQRFQQESLALKAAAILLAILSRLILAVPLILTAVFGMAWWRLRSGHPSARRWGFAASIFMLLSAGPMAPAIYEMRDPRFPAWIATTCTIVMLISVAAGISGIIAFRKKNAASELPADTPLPRVAGDGTHKALDAIALVLQIGGTIALLDLYTRWGYEHDLPFTHGLESWIQWIVVILAVTIIHEAAHAVVGVAAGMKLRAFVIGPFQSRVHEGRWIFEFRPTQILAASGAAGLTPVDPDQSRWNEVAMIAAGPFSNLLTGAVAAAFAYSAEGTSWEPWWEYFAMFATVSLVAGIVNLIPFRPESLYSDGARIVQLFRHSPAADFHRVIKTVSCTLVSARRPRDYDIEAIQRASAHFTAGHQALLLRLFATSYYFEHDLLAGASAALADAERIYRESASDAPAELHTSFIIKGIILGRSPAWLREWWHSMEQKKPTNLNQDYWLAKAVFHWAAHDPVSAREAFKTGTAYLEKLPDAGTYNYDRDCYARINPILDAPPVESGLTAPEEAQPSDIRPELLPSPAS